MTDAIYTKTLLLPADVWNRNKKHRTTVTIDPSESKFITSYRRDNGLYKGMTLLDLTDGREVAVVRWYFPASTCYCCVWIYGATAAPVYTSGSNRAGGYGYDKTSTSFNGALINCGVRNFPRFSGSGCNDDAMMWLAKILGVRRPKIVEFYA